MIICPKCKTENPSKAQFCLQCGAILGDGVLPEDVRMQKDLAIAKETVEILQKSLGESQSELAAAIAEKENLQIEIDAQKSQIDNLTEKLSASIALNDQLKNKKGKKGKNGKWGWVFVILSSILFFVVIYLSDSVSNLKSRLWDDQNGNKEAITQLKREKSELENSLQTYTKKCIAVESDLSHLTSRLPIVITSVEIADTYQSGGVRQDFGNTLYFNRDMFLQPKVHYTGYTDKEVKFYVKWYNRNGLYTNYSSPSGYSLACTRSVHKGDNIVTLDHFGDDYDYDFWGTGSHRLEIWVGNMCLYSKSFTIYY